MAQHDGVLGVGLSNPLEPVQRVRALADIVRRGDDLRQVLHAKLEVARMAAFSMFLSAYREVHDPWG